MKHFAKVLIGIGLAIALTSCSAPRGGRIKGQDTSVGVQLSQNNYKVIRAGISGKSRGFRLLGLIPLSSPSYGSAKKDLYRNVGEPLTGRSIALTNQTEDRTTLYLILFSIPKLTLTADVIEFTQ